MIEFGHSREGKHPIGRASLPPACLAVAFVLWAAPAFAASVTNRDDKDVKITIVIDGKDEDRVLKPAEAVDGVCPKGCVIRLNDSKNDEYVLQGPEVVSVEAGYLYYDGPPGAAGAPPGGAPDGEAPAP